MQEKIKDKLISVEHLKWNVGGIKCGTLSVDYLNWILDHEEPAVDAIPVEWINEWCLSQNLTYIRLAVEKMLEDWGRNSEIQDEGKTVRKRQGTE